MILYNCCILSPVFFYKFVKAIKKLKGFTTAAFVLQFRYASILFINIIIIFVENALFLNEFEPSS